MARHCLLGHVDPTRLDEYRRHHEAVWPDLLHALRDAGWDRYSLFLHDDGTLVAFVEAEDLSAAQAAVAATAVNAEWQRQMQEYFVGDGPPDEAWQELPEVFDLDEQLGRTDSPAELAARLRASSADRDPGTPAEVSTS